MFLYCLTSLKLQQTKVHCECTRVKHSMQCFSNLFAQRATCFWSLPQDTCATDYTLGNTDVEFNQ